MKKPVVIFGTEKIAELAHFYFTHDSDIEIAAFTVDSQYKKGNEFMGLPLVEFENIEEKYSPENYDMFVAIGYKRLNSIREKKYYEAKKKGYSFITYISTKSIVSEDLKIGENCFILENQVIQPNVTIGNNVVMWSGNHLGHDVKIGNHNWLSSHIVVSGNVTIGNNCFVGVNATLGDHISIGNESILGAGSLILKNAEEKSVFIEKQTILSSANSDKFRRFF